MLGVATLASILAMSAPAEAAVTFNFTFTAGTSAQAQQAFIDAGNRWSTLFSDNATVNLTVGTASLAPGILGQAASRRVSFSYTDFKTALAADAKSAADTSAVSHLAGGSSFGMLINRTSDSPNGAGSATPYVDSSGANNSTINMTAANARALGLNAGSGTVGICTSNCDAGIQFNSDFAFDYDPTDGISVGEYDFVGIATHEIGHALGFISGVDILDINSPPLGGPFLADQFVFVSPLDMFRYSDASGAAGVIDWTADTRAKYFSLDGGATAGPLFSTGVNFGDGRQASHWKDSLGIGIMDPTAATGEFLSISSFDALGFDAIGWDLAGPQDVPEPASWAMMITGFAMAGGAMRLRRRGEQRRRVPA
ncbi:hypothetical protein ACFB49_05130 [Sphingomonas sp. DBB INV C78]